MSGIKPAKDSKYLISEFVIYIPLFILGILGAGYVLVLLSAPIALERVQFLIGLDAAIATTAGLSLYASYTSRDELKKSIYYRVGESLFHAFVLIIIATFIRSSIYMLDDFHWYTVLKWPVQIVLVSGTIIFFTLGMVRLIFGLRNLLRYILLKDG